jgi:hypothetical protein
LLGSYSHCTSSEDRAIQHQIRVSAHYFFSLTFVPKFQPYRRHKRDEVLVIRTLTEQRLRARILFGCSTRSDALNRLWELIRRSAPCDFTFHPTSTSHVKFLPSKWQNHQMSILPTIKYELGTSHTPHSSIISYNTGVSNVVQNSVTSNAKRTRLPYQSTTVVRMDNRPHFMWCSVCMP